MTDYDEKDRATSQKLSQLGTEIDLLLSQEDKLQKALWDVTEKIFNCDKLEEREAMDKDMIHCCWPSSSEKRVGKS